MRGARSAGILSALVVALVLLGVGCGNTIPKEALQLGPESLQQRQMQSRVYDTGNEADILSASAGVLQDLGFNLDESESELGVIVASKDRSAVEAGQVAAAIMISLFTNVQQSYDRKQKIRVSLVSRPYGDSAKRTAVRVTFQRLVWDNEDKLSRAEILDDSAMYQEFFAQLSKAIFLEAHQI